MMGIPGFAKLMYTKEGGRRLSVMGIPGFAKLMYTKERGRGL